MASSDFRLPSRDDEDSSDTRSFSSKRSRHVSLQSRVDSLAAESMWEEDGAKDAVPDIPAIYAQDRLRERSTSSLLEPLDGTRARWPTPVDGYSKAESYQRTSSPTIPPDPYQPLRITPFHEFLFIGVTVMAQFMALAGLGQALAPEDIIAEGLNVDNPGQKAWFTAGYSLTVGTFILISGRIGDILGHKRMFVFGYFFLGVWSGFAGFSAYLGRQVFFDVCRAMQGIGAAMLAPNALALLGRAYPPGMKKNLVFSLFGAMAPWGFVFGALFGSIFSELAWWPWTFWTYGIAAWTLSALALLVVPKALNHEAQFVTQAGRPGMDWTGSALGVAGLVLVNVAWNNGPLYGWSTPHVYFILIIGLMSLMAFVYVEARALSPLLPVKFLNGTVTYTMALVAIGWGSFGIWVFYSWRFLMEIRGQSPLTVSAEYTPALICGLLAAGATGFMLTHTPVSFVIMIAMVAFFVGNLIGAFQPVHQVYWAQMFVSILIMPFGMDMSFPASTIVLSNQMPPEHQGLAASLVNTIVNYSISIALGIAGTVEVSVTNRGTTFEDTVWGIQCARYTGVGLAGFGVLLGALFFGRTMMKEGWKVMEH
ncbi:hypothetical protein LTR85_010761 [Meristemomyces frigidus]|nr:hypothetical protein LTR85_010761 [Meristemomyces frigidus]